MEIPLGELFSQSAQSDVINGKEKVFSKYIHEPPEDVVQEDIVLEVLEIPDDKIDDKIDERIEEEQMEDHKVNHAIN